MVSAATSLVLIPKSVRVSCPSRTPGQHTYTSNCDCCTLSSKVTKLPQVQPYPRMNPTSSSSSFCFFNILSLSHLYTQRGTQTHNPEMKNLHAPLSQPSAPPHLPLERSPSHTAGTLLSSFHSRSPCIKIIKASTRHLQFCQILKVYLKSLHYRSLSLSFQLHAIPKGEGGEDRTM